MTIRFTFTAPSSWSATTPWCSCFKFLGCFLVYFVFCSALRIVVVPPSPSRITRLEPPSHPHLRLPSWSASSPSSGWDVDVDVDMVVAVARLFNVWVLFEFIEWIPGKTQEFVFGLSVVFGSALCFLFFLILLFFAPRSECTWCIKIAYGVLNFRASASVSQSCLYGFAVIKDGQVIMTFLAGHPITCDRQEIGEDQRA